MKRATDNTITGNGFDVFQQCNGGKYHLLAPLSFFSKSLYYNLCLLLVLLLVVASCSISKQISKQAVKVLLKDSVIRTGHIGISIYEPATGQYWYNYDAAKYFVPASNTKLFSLYAGLKYLGDSLPGIRYEIDNDSVIRIQPTADPTFLHPEFSSQPVFNLLRRFKKITFSNLAFTENFFGSGWAWDDYEEVYMTQRSNFPLYANLSRVKKMGDSISITPPTQKYIIPEHTNFETGFDILKKRDENLITIISGMNQSLSVPFSPNAPDIIAMLQDTLHAIILPGDGYLGKLKNIIHSQPADSLFKPMMHRSDNFFAEQTLLMASNEHIGYMSDQKMIDTLLSNDLKDIPQKPKWVDGSGLSRYNLFSPQSFVYILNKMKNEFGLERLKNILPTGGEGTIKAYYKKDSGYIFAKTGTLSNHCALSGFLITKKNKLLIFSVLANHYQGAATPVRIAIEKFITAIRERY
ncbi:MAG: D-alanyl-D-alanine carboxypeptidase [Ferruginibacter sp.]